MENLLQGVLYDVGGRATKLLLNAEQVQKLLETLPAVIDLVGTVPECIAGWRLTKATRAKKVLTFHTRDTRIQDLWRSVQSAEKVYIGFEELMSQQEYRAGSEVDAKWSLFAMTSCSERNPVLQLLHAVYSQFSSGEWHEYRVWFYGTGALPASEIDRLEDVLGGVVGRVWKAFVPRYLWGNPEQIVPAGDPHLTIGERQSHWDRLINKRY